MISSAPSKPFISAGLVEDPLYVFAVQRCPTLVDLDDEGSNLVILSNGSDVAAIYRRAAGPTQSWQRFIQWLPWASRETAILDAREMDRWMFQRRSAASIVDRIAVNNDGGRAFLEEIGATLVGQDEHEAIYQTVGALH